MHTVGFYDIIKGYNGESVKERKVRKMAMRLRKIACIRPAFGQKKDCAPEHFRGTELRIGIYTDTFYPEINGVATSCLMLEQELSKRGHLVHVFAPKCHGWEEHKKENVHYLASAPFIALKDRNVAFPGLNEMLNIHPHNFDVIHTNTEFVMGYLGTRIARLEGCPLVHTYHTVWEDYTYYITHGTAIDAKAKSLTRKYSEWWCNRFDRVISPSDKTKNLLLSYGVDSAIDVIPTGMDIARFAPELHSSQQRELRRRECGIKPGERVLLNIGRIAKEKNLTQILRIFPKLHSVYPDVRFVIIGEGPQRQELSEMAQSLGIAEYVTQTGPKPWENIDQYYAVGDVFCSASHTETQGLTYIEAMASGLCVCAMDDPCLDGVIYDGINGILSEDSDDALLGALIRAFGREGEQIAKNAVASVERYTAERFASEVEKCYMRAIADQHKRLIKQESINERTPEPEKLVLD